jgi:lipopolysaccharide export system protein LptA
MIPGATAHPRSGTGRRSPGLLWAAVALCTAPAGASAQAVCQVVSSERVNAVTLFTGTRLIFASRPDVECDDGTRIQADSAEVNEGAGVSRFFGNFRFRDPTRSLTSGFAEFYDQQDRLLAWQDVVLTQSADGSVMRGDTLEYYRASDFIQEDLLSMRGGRVRSTLPPRAGTGAPYDVESDRLVIQGEDRVTATGMVSVVRDSLRAWGDTMTFNPDTDRLRLGGLARIEGETYELTGGVIDLLVPADTLREVLAQRNPVLTTEGMVLTAPREIRIDLEAGEIERLVAVGDPPPASPEGAGSPEGALRAPRPRAEAEDFVLVGDSLDVAVPGGALERVVAIGDARENRSGSPPPRRNSWNWRPSRRSCGGSGWRGIRSSPPSSRTNRPRTPCPFPSTCRWRSPPLRTPVRHATGWTAWWRSEMPAASTGSLPRTPRRRPAAAGLSTMSPGGRSPCSWWMER